MVALSVLALASAPPEAEKQRVEQLDGVTKTLSWAAPCDSANSSFEYRLARRESRLTLNMVLPS